MADSKIRQIIGAIKSKIAVSYAGETSELDLTNKVVIGAVIEPPYLPYGSIVFLQSTSDYGQTMDRYRVTANFEVYGFVGGSSVSERTMNAMDLASDMIKALTADRQLGIPSIVDDIKCAFTAEDGDRYGIEGAGIGYIQIEVFYQTDTGS
jgi:hypothetical protein|tara:strand:+ start:57 stop:509 length:453 start_codon:yes stop_codon:yes gene_type:complete